MRQLVYQVCYTKYQYLFYLRQVGPVLKNCKVPKYYDQDCLQIFPLLSTVPVPVSRKKVHLAQKVSSIKKLPVNKAESFLMPNIDLKQIYMQNSANTKLLNLKH